MPIKFRTAFFIAFASLLILPLFFPNLHLFFFAPALVIGLYRSAMLSSLWKGFFCGLLFDLFSSTTFFGLTSFNTTLTLAVLYRQKRHFFEDSLTTLPLMTFHFSILSTLIASLFTLFSTFSFAWIFTDLVIMPLLDSLYAFALFSLPFQLYKHFRRVSPKWESEE